MKKLLSISLMLAVLSSVQAETVKLLDREVVVRHPNYDESKIAPYKLEDPLVFLDGRKVSREEWPSRRREILNIFAKEMYGEEPAS